ncbi:hypothetical protein BX661DRAFT_178758 [Kickxella alabastrina]|uniref:uncharacterized protein n=1 Tax=Kickxella alabastrina TaxID=61397 RepID=UPI0022206DB1|nr:uncharacterized protein BX661DRAFT_178758 [Kickxella alabastrina]KAI7832905.1 hypothetical protein BX661DRAFT_178758 [Kickxella alabastrina]
MALADTEDAAAEAASMDVTSPEPAPTPAPGPELVSARILSDPELMYAASIPLPNTPAVAADQSTPKRAAPGDFYIPADWLMNPNSETQQQRQQRASRQPESPLQRFSAMPSADHPHSGDLIPVTPANQKLLDSLEIQWVSPRLVAKFSEADMEAERLSFDEKLGQRDELHRMIMESVKEEFAAQMRQAEQAAEDAAQRARDLAQRQMEQVQREHEAALRAQRAQHREEIQRRDEDTRSQVAELSREIENALAERMALVEDRDATQATLEQLMAVSTALEEEKNQHIHGLEQELGSLTVERRRLLQQLAEALTAAEELSAERDDVVKRVEALTLENVRMEELANALGSDVLVAEERSTKIKEYAESTLAAANAEIASAHDQLGALRHEVGLLRTQNAKAENRARSLQIQLDSTKRQNEELVAHYNSM